MKKILSLLVLVTTAATAVAEEAAGGHAPGIPWGEIAKQCINFTILVVVLVYFLKKPLTSFLKERSELMKKAIEDAGKARAEAAEKLSAIEARVSKLPEELAEMNRRTDAEAAEEVKRIHEASEAEAARIRAQAELSAEQEVKKAREALRQEAAELSSQAAEEIVKKAMTPQDQERLVRENLEKIREIVK